MKAFSEADTRTRKELTAAIASAKNDLNSEMRKIFGGEDPEILDRLQPVLDTFAANLDKKANAGTSELLAHAAKPFDRMEPTLPMARHAAELMVSREQLAAQLDKNHTDLISKVLELSTAVKIQDAKTSLAKVTPIKGASYEVKPTFRCATSLEALVTSVQTPDQTGVRKTSSLCESEDQSNPYQSVGAGSYDAVRGPRGEGPLAIQIEGNNGRCRAGV